MWKKEEQKPHFRKHDINKFYGKKYVHHGDIEIKTEVSKRGGCYIYGGRHGYARCCELESLGANLRKRKEKEHMSKNKVRR